MSKVLIVATREFIETVRTRAFFLTVVLMPGIIIAGIYGTSAVQRLSQNDVLPERTIALVTDAPAVAAELRRQIAGWSERNPNSPLALAEFGPPLDAGGQPASSPATAPVAASAAQEHGAASAPVDALAAAQQAAAAAVRERAAFAYIIVPQAALAGDAPVVIGRTEQQLALGNTLQTLVNDALINVRFAAHDPPLDREVVRRLQSPVAIETLDALSGARLTGTEQARLLTPFVFMFLMMVGIFGVAQGLLTSVMEEKSSRVVEVLLSAVSPTQLMAGKILGVSLVGLLLLLAWGGAGYFGAERMGVGHLVGGYRLTYVALYFVPGFLMTAALLAAIGAACNQLKEAQSMAFPLSLLNLIPLVFWLYITEHPQSPISILLSFIPPITPLVMVLRICADPHLPLWQIIATQAVLWVGVIVMIWAAGRVFRVGVLMYGKPPSLRELLRWVKAA